MQDIQTYVKKTHANTQALSEPSSPSLGAILYQSKQMTCCLFLSPPTVFFDVWLCKMTRHISQADIITRRRAHIFRPHAFPTGLPTAGVFVSESTARTETETHTRIERCGKASMILTLHCVLSETGSRNERERLGWRDGEEG